ncbi:hypothetical protein ACTMU2_10510 [Cupriavidus basilensis]
MPNATSTCAWATTVTAIAPSHSVATCADGREIRFSACLLATGGSARTLPDLPPGTPNVLPAHA